MSTISAGPRGEFDQPLVQTFARGLRVLTAFNGGESQLTISQVAERAEISRASARRLLATLVELGYVRTVGRKFGLRAKVLELGVSFLRQMALPDLAQPHLDKFTRDHGRSVSIAILDGYYVAYICRSRLATFPSAPFFVGSRFLAHLTPAGLLLLAGNNEDENNAYFDDLEKADPPPSHAYDRESLTETINEVREHGYLFETDSAGVARVAAVPIHDKDGRLFAAIQLAEFDANVESRELNLDAMMDLRKRVQSVVTWSSQNRLDFG